MRFDLVDLRLFVNVVEAAGITRGAERSHLASASASARIRGLEDALGTPLLVREQRGVAPTPAGLALLRHARALLQQVESMRGELAQYASGVRGSVRILSNTAALVEFLPDALAGYLALEPDVDVDLAERPSHEILRAVVEREADIGVLADLVDAAGLETFPFRQDQLVLVVPEHHRLARRRRLAFRDVLGFDFVGLPGDSALQRHLDERALHAGRRMRVRARFPSFDAICRLVAHGAGIAVVPVTAARRCQAYLPIRPIRLTDTWALRRISLCTRRRAELPQHARDLLDYLSASGGSVERPPER
ncbi:MAG TPA: LysR substrate-binding domain-containing protein [Pelomicrobium sp.]|nr:LysR substrate-binding domain-containing protein [Pelomicrobium sp.]